MHSVMQRCMAGKDEKRSSSPRDGFSAPKGGALTGPRKASIDSIYTYETKSQDLEAEKTSTQIAMKKQRQKENAAQKGGEKYAIL